MKVHIFWSVVITLIPGVITTAFVSFTTTVPHTTIITSSNYTPTTEDVHSLPYSERTFRSDSPIRTTHRSSIHETEGTYQTSSTKHQPSPSSPESISNPSSSMRSEIGPSVSIFEVATSTSESDLDFSMNGTIFPSSISKQLTLEGINIENTTYDDTMDLSPKRKTSLNDENNATETSSSSTSSLELVLASSSDRGMETLGGLEVASFGIEGLLQEDNDYDIESTTTIESVNSTIVDVKNGTKKSKGAGRKRKYFVNINERQYSKIRNSDSVGSINSKLNINRQSDKLSNSTLDNRKYDENQHNKTNNEKVNLNEKRVLKIIVGGVRTAKLDKGKPTTDFPILEYEVVNKSLSNIKLPSATNNIAKPVNKPKPKTNYNVVSRQPFRPGQLSSLGGYQRYHYGSNQHQRESFMVSRQERTVSPTPSTEPYFEAGPNNISAQHGTHAFLPCTVRHLGNKSISWIRSRDSHILTVDHFTFIADERFQAWRDPETETWTLQVKYVQARDNGTYECQVSTEPKISHMVNLHVVTPLVYIDGGTDVHVKSGSTVTLRCIISKALEHPDYIFWYQGSDRVLDGSHGRSLFVERVSPDTTMGTLLMPAATPRDQGNYRCQPANLPKAQVTLHVLNGEHADAMHHGTGYKNDAPWSIIYWSFIVILLLRHHLYISQSR
ncbi:unnamed protein product [Meganyctiphanes norvegica]|uniref:Ig-like domain-containing protein n=1 Tax=Meganyctiphanes norvegica TaxID=48144 RepID=A0AAV2Q7J2_MEGNR